MGLRNGCRSGGAQEGERGRGGGPGTVEDGPEPTASSAEQVPAGWRGRESRKAGIRKREGGRDPFPSVTHTHLGSDAWETERCGRRSRLRARASQGPHPSQREGALHMELQDA